MKCDYCQLEREIETSLEPELCFPNKEDITKTPTMLKVKVDLCRPCLLVLARNQLEIQSMSNLTVAQQKAVNNKNIQKE